MPFDSVAPIYHTFTKKSFIPLSLSVTTFDKGLGYFENLNVISSNFDDSLGLLGIRRSALEIFNGPLRYSRKIRGLQLL